MEPAGQEQIFLTQPVIEKICEEISWSDLAGLIINRNLRYVNCRKLVQDEDKLVLSFEKIDAPKIHVARLIESIGSKNTLIYLTAT